MADALNDFVTLTNAAGNLIGNLSRLQDTRIELESARIASEINRRNALFLSDMTRKVGDPNRIDSNNWRDKLAQHNSDIESVIGTVKSTGVKNIVQSRIGEITNGFMVGVSQKMFAQEMEIAKSDARVNIDNIYNDSSKSWSERVADIDSWTKKYSDEGILDGKELAELYSKYRTQANVNSIVDFAMSRWSNASNEELSSYSDRFSMAMAIVDSDSSLREVDKSLAKNLIMKASSENDKAYEDGQWENIFTTPEKNGVVNIEHAETSLAAADISSSKKAELYSRLEAYSGKKFDDTLEYGFNSVFRSLPVEAKFNSEVQDRARKYLNDMGSTRLGLLVGQKKVGDMHKEIDGFTQNSGGSEAAAKEAINRMNLLATWFHTKATGPDGKLLVTRGRLISELVNDPEIKKYAAREAFALLKDVENGAIGVNARDLELLKKEGYIYDLAVLIAKNDKTASARTKDFVNKLTKTGKDYDKEANASFNVAMGYIYDVIIQEIQDNKQSTTIESVIANTGFRAKVISIIERAQDQYTRRAVGLLDGSSKYGEAYTKLLPKAFDKYGAEIPGDIERIRDTVSYISGEAKKIIPQDILSGLSPDIKRVPSDDGIGMNLEVGTVFLKNRDDTKRYVAKYQNGRFVFVEYEKRTHRDGKQRWGIVKQHEGSSGAESSKDIMEYVYAGGDRY